MDHKKPVLYLHLLTFGKMGGGGGEPYSTLEKFKIFP